MESLIKFSIDDLMEEIMKASNPQITLVLLETLKMEIDDTIGFVLEADIKSAIRYIKDGDILTDEQKKDLANKLDKYKLNLLCYKVGQMFKAS